MGSFSSSDATNGTRLDNWDAIANHVGRSRRTAQRWHADLGLPVHHLGQSKAVFAYSDEIDRWFQQIAASPWAETMPTSSSDLRHSSATAESVFNEDPTHTLGHAQDGKSHALVAEAHKLWTMVSGNNLHTIARLFREAVDADPCNAEAYAGISHALVAQGMLGNLDLKSAYSGARLAADKALVIDPNSSEAVCAEAWLQMVCHRNWDRSRVLFNRISSGEPTNTRVTVGRALLHIVTGDCKVASNLLYLASQQNSLSGLSLGLHSWSDYLAGDFSEAMDHVSQAWGSGRRNPIVGVVEALTCTQLMHGEDAIQRVGTRIQEDPKNDVVRGALGYLYGTNGREESARRILHDLNREHSHARENSHYAIALVYLGIGEVSQAVQSLERSYEEGSLWSLALHLDPALRSLAGHPEFERFINKAYPATEMP